MNATAAALPPTLDRRAPESRERRLLVDTVGLGVLGAVAAQAFTWLLGRSSDLFLGRLAGYRPPGESGASPEVIGAHGLWLLPVVTTLGGLIVGLVVERWAPEAEGHGTDAAIKAFHRSDGLIRARVPFVKLFASAITIGSGGAAGREGPMALIAGGMGSWYATVTGRDGRDRRLLLMVGMAAGLSAIFRSPIGAALLAVEVLYADMEFEPGALLYTALGAIVAYALNGMIVGWQPLFRVPALVGQLPNPLDYLWYVVLGLAAGLAATALPMVFYGARDLFRRVPVRPMWKPALGGLATGLIALAFPHVISGGYGWMQRAIDGQIALGTLAALVAAKTVAMSATVGSGGSGGVFAPIMFVGAMLGGTCAAVFHQPAAPFVVVGMAAVFAGAAHVPIATMMMVTEMTGGYTLLVPAALAVVLSYLVQRRFSRGLRYRCVYEAQVASRADSPAHHTKHLEIALKILNEKGLRNVAHAGELDLLSLLRSGIPVEMPGDRRLLVAAIRPGSALIDRAVAATGALLGDHDSSIVAVIRGEHMLAPRPDLVLGAGDRLILVSAVAELDRVWEQVEPW
ncbi:MAG: chloride channel protein [Gemmatimonadales bacterium]